MRHSARPWFGFCLLVLRFIWKAKLQSEEETSFTLLIHSLNGHNGACASHRPGTQSFLQVSCLLRGRGPALGPATAFPEALDHMCSSGVSHKYLKDWSECLDPCTHVDLLPPSPAPSVMAIWGLGQYAILLSFLLFLCNSTLQKIK